MSERLRLRHSPSEKDPTPKLRNGVAIEEAWKAQRDLASQWEKVNKLHRLAGRVSNAEHQGGLLDKKIRLSELKEMLTERVAQEEQNLTNAMQQLHELYDLPDWRLNSTQVDDTNLITELERELDK